MTNARATDDYFHPRASYPRILSMEQWAIGATSLLYWALGILPFKDGFYSSSRPQLGGQTVGPETRPDREALIASLSGAMVGPMDGIGLLNASRVLATCRADGYVLKPDAPLATSDECFRTGEDPGKCHLYVATSAVRGLPLPARYIFSNDGPARPITPRAAGIADADAHRFALYNWYTRAVAPLAPSNVLAASYEGHAYAVATPLLAGWALLGEVDKYVPLSTLRFARASTSVPSASAAAAAGSAASPPDLVVEIVGAAGETVRVCAAPPAAPPASGFGGVQCRRAAFERAGSRVLTFEAGGGPGRVRAE